MGAFTNRRIGYTSFYGKNYNKTQRINCIADEVDINNFNLSKSNFAGTDLMNAIFNNTDLTQANLVGAPNYKISSKVNKIKKAKCSLPESLSFLYNVDIILVDWQYVG